MSRKPALTDAEVAAEIVRLSSSEHVKAFEAEQRRRYAMRQRLYNLRWMEKRGREIAAQRKEARA